MIQPCITGGGLAFESQSWQFKSEQGLANKHQWQRLEFLSPDKI